MNSELPIGDETGGGGEGGLMSMLQSLGMMSALRTGDPKMDIMIAMMIPMVLRFGISMLTNLRSMADPQWIRKMYRERNYHQRRLVHTTGGPSLSYNSEEEQRTYVLIKAILLYVHFECPHVQHSMREAVVEFTSMSGDFQQSGDNYDHQDAGASRKTAVDVLKHFKVIKRPPENQWHRVGFFGNPTKCFVDMMLSNESVTQGEGKKASTKHRMELSFISPSANAMDELIAKAHTWYMDMLRKNEDQSRYLYELTKIEDPDTSSPDYYYDSRPLGPQYKRYKLSDHKTFSTLFFKEKERLLKLLNDFSTKGGKYSIEGYPYKLGLLLHGPPGTGKTSLIKALAQYTGRSIVNVPIAKVEKNSQLMSIFYDRKFNVQGEDVPIQLGFEDIIYVMEDIDAASTIVHRRDGKQTADILRSQTFDAPDPKCIFQLLLESSDDTCKEAVEKMVEESPRLKKYATQPEVVKEICRKMMILPGLSLIGHSDETAAKIGKQTVDQVGPLMEQYETRDRFLAMHAQHISSALTAGVELSHDLVDMLLGQGDYTGTPGLLKRNVSYSKVNNKDKMQLDIGMHEDNEGEDDLRKLLGKMGGLVEDKKDKESGFGQYSKKFIDSDKLSLSGILNVLDGVVDSPGRILVMTSNHPEKLDPALIRPGRIDKKLKLGYMDNGNVLEMLEHYFQTKLSEALRNRVIKAIEGDSVNFRPKLEMTPAQIEQLSAEHEEIEDMICALEKKGGSEKKKGKFGSHGKPELVMAAIEGYDSRSSVRFDA